MFKNENTKSYTVICNEPATFYFWTACCHVGKTRLISVCIIMFARASSRDDVSPVVLRTSSGTRRTFTWRGSGVRIVPRARADSWLARRRLRYLFTPMLAHARSTSRWIGRKAQFSGKRLWSCDLASARPQPNEHDEQAIERLQRLRPI